MGKFSYALEFYNNNIFDLDNVKLFKYKVKEAEEIEKYFSQVIYNVDFIRKYIIRSYYFNKSARFNRRISYIKGLILGEEYVDFNDLTEFSDYIRKNLFMEPKLSLWKYKGYFDDPKNEDFFEGIISDKDEYEVFALVSSKSIDYGGIDEDEDLEDETDENNEENEDLEDETDENNEENIIEEEDEIDKDLESEFIQMHPKEKIIQFKNMRKKYIDEIIKNKKIDSEEIGMVKKGMTDWINYILNSMEDIYRIKEYTLRYNDENISKYI